MSARMKAWKSVRGHLGGTGGTWGAWVNVSVAIDDAARALLELTHGRKFIWAKQNNLLVAYLYDWPEGERKRMIQLTLFRADGGRGIEWRHKQQAKNELLGFEVEAVELFPAESRLIDADHEYHLWIDPATPHHLDFGFFERGRQVNTEEQRRAQLAALAKRR